MGNYMMQIKNLRDFVTRIYKEFDEYVVPVTEDELSQLWDEGYSHE